MSEGPQPGDVIGFTFGADPDVRRRQSDRQAATLGRAARGGQEWTSRELRELGDCATDRDVERFADSNGRTFHACMQRWRRITRERSVRQR